MMPFYRINHQRHFKAARPSILFVQAAMIKIVETEWKKMLIYIVQTLTNLHTSNPQMATTVWLI